MAAYAVPLLVVGFNPIALGEGNSHYVHRKTTATPHPVRAHATASRHLIGTVSAVISRVICHDAPVLQLRLFP
jgi:hypothetical protein